MPLALTAIIVLCYVTLALELTVLRVASVASSLNILKADADITSGYSGRFAWVFRLPRAAKVLLFVLPVLVIYAVYAYPLLVLVSGPDPFGDYLFEPATLTFAGGAALMLGGRALTLIAMFQVRRQNRQRGDSFHLHTTGLFGWSRNPGLVGLYLFVLGLWLAMPAASLLAGLFAYIGYMDFKIRMEEDFLAGRFGEDYRRYQAETGRYC